MGEFGQKLKQEREKRGITLEEVALATKIGTRMLRALEEEHFSQLPGGIFNKGFIRAYARHLGLNAEELVADYLSALNATLPQPPVPAEPKLEVRASAARQAGLVTWERLAAALLVVAVVLGFWNLRSRRSAAPPPPLTAKNTPSPVVVPSAPKQQPPAPQPVATAGSAPVAMPLVSAGTPPIPAEASQPATGLFHVLVRAREDAWVRVTADGKEIMQNTLLADGQRYIAAQREIVIKSGNVGGLEFWFNGEKLPAQGDPDQVKTLTFDPRGLVAPTARVQPPLAGGVSQP